MDELAERVVSVQGIEIFVRAKVCSSLSVLSSMVDYAVSLYGLEIRLMSIMVE